MENKVLKEKIYNLRSAMSQFLQYADKLTEEELCKDRTLNELVLNVETSKIYADILLGDKENPISNYQY